ncbi:MAG: bifunctional diaminohydroxyphosphoribosylaminopyrimidine deaminase/5-amino-6-(5-phosphoribosylamino)uracil reductase RibD [Saprospiraceae bacterium]|nr:bifunctional diaminohydroxyphosphoribosylaminopyrimidine deaminase/5-amino-6-(5-phosphoribosylamino)uracil reductase RibD [Saprospiraceae bacterium]
MMNQDELYIQRCFDLARLGAGNVSPNPMVGAVLVYENHIIGEGFHQKYGEAHAEVNAVNSVKPADRALIEQSTLYVSLEPCCIYGRTPPCTNLIIKHKIPKVIISCLDQTPGVAGQGVQLLRNHGVEVITGILEAQGQELVRFRNHFVTRNRPYVVLKFAQTLDGFMGLPDEQIWISNEFSKRLVHKWRSEVDAILIGTKTALIDNPQLNNRLYFGKSPLRIVLDRNLILPQHLHIFDQNQPTLIVTENSSLKPASSLPYLELNFEDDFLNQLLKHLHQQKITTLLVEGGSKILQSFIEQDLWDEAYVFIGNKTIVKGIPAPTLPGPVIARFSLGSDQMIRYQNVHIR